MNGSCARCRRDVVGHNSDWRRKAWPGVWLVSEAVWCTQQNDIEIWQDRRCRQPDLAGIINRQADQKIDAGRQIQARTVARGVRRLC